MTNSSDDDSASDPKVGYGKPPVHSRFRKGRSGNPGGRPRGMTRGRAETFVLEEAYRMVTVREGDKITTLPAFKALVRSQFAHAVKGNGPAQRALSESVRAIERELAAADQTMNQYRPDPRPASPRDMAKALLAIFNKDE